MMTDQNLEGVYAHIALDIEMTDRSRRVIKILLEEIRFLRWQLEKTNER